MSFRSRLRAAIFDANVQRMSVKSRFVQTILSDEGNRLLKNQGLAMQRKLVFHTHEN